MARIEFVDVKDTQFVKVLDLYPDGDPEAEKMKAKIPSEELEGQAVRFIVPGGPEALQLFEVKCDPDVQFNTHAHDEDEIIYVTQGSIVLGKREHGVGSAIMIPGKTLYGFKSGAEGLTFLNFRAAADFTYITRDELMQERAESGSAAQPA